MKQKNTFKFKVSLYNVVLYTKTKKKKFSNSKQQHQHLNTLM